jgi:hypothetical protein
VRERVGDEEREQLHAEDMGAMQEYFDMASAEEMAVIEEVKRETNVVPIRPEVRHTDTELVPETLADVMFAKLVFDPKANLMAAAHEAWLLDDLLPATGMAFVYGPPGSYKSFVAVDMSMCVATGKDWHGVECEQPGGVLYIAAEGARGVDERRVAWMEHWQRFDAKLVVLPVAVMFDEVLMVEAFIDCATRASEALGCPIRMVVIDTMARTFNGDENSAQEVGAYVNACGRFAAELNNCLVMVIAHTGKDLTRGIRGSSALLGAADCTFMVTKPGEGQALMKNTKQKDIEMAEPMRFAMQSVSTGIPDRKNRIRRTLVPLLESRGEDADPDSEEVSAFDHKDTTVLVGMVKAHGKIGEDELRKEFLAHMASEGKKPDSARKTWARSYARARDQGRIMKAGIFLYPEGK